MKHLVTFLFCLFTTLKHTNTSAFEIVKTPAAENSLAPNLCAFGDQFVLNWIERNKDGRGLAANLCQSGQQEWT